MNAVGIRGEVLRIPMGDTKKKIVERLKAEGREDLL